MIDMSKLLIAVATATTLLSIMPTQAQAQDQGSFYVGGGLGLVFGGNTRADGIFSSTGSVFDGQRLGPEPGSTARGNFDSSPATRLTLGYDLGERRFGRFRFEGELFYQKADTNKYSGELNGSELNPAGQVNTAMSGVAVNALYDIGDFSRVQPYVYLGYGYAKVKTQYNFSGLGQVEISGNSEILQAGFGVEVPFNERTSFDLRYRFRRAGLNEGGLDTDIDANTIELGIRYTF